MRLGPKHAAWWSTSTPTPRRRGSSRICRPKSGTRRRKGGTPPHCAAPTSASRLSWSEAGSRIPNRRVLCAWGSWSPSHRNHHAAPKATCHRASRVAGNQPVVTSIMERKNRLARKRGSPRNRRGNLGRSKSIIRRRQSEREKTHRHRHLSTHPPDTISQENQRRPQAPHLHPLVSGRPMMCRRMKRRKRNALPPRKRAPRNLSLVPRTPSSKNGSICPMPTGTKCCRSPSWTSWWCESSQSSITNRR